MIVGNWQGSNASMVRRCGADQCFLAPLNKETQFSADKRTPRIAYSVFKFRAEGNGTAVRQSVPIVDSLRRGSHFGEPGVGETRLCAHG